MPSMPHNFWLWCQLLKNFRLHHIFKMITLLHFYKTTLLFHKSVSYMEMPRWLYTTEKNFLNWVSLRLNLHDNVCGIPFILPGESASLSYELIMSTAFSRELAGENISVFQGWLFYAFRMMVINDLYRFSWRHILYNI